MENFNCGIYQIRNVVNDHVYIGQAGNFTKRKRQHFNNLKKNKHHNRHLQFAYNKYGVDNFEFEILLNCDLEDLTRYEQMFVDEFDPEYNINKECVDSSKGAIPWNKGVKISDEAKKKMSESLKGRTVWNKGLKGSVPWNKNGGYYSEETRRKMSDSHKGKKFSVQQIESMSGKIPWNKGKFGYTVNRKGVVYSKESRQKMSDSHKGKMPPNKGQKYSEEKKQIMREKRQATKLRKLSENV